jgi:hypothetical protein
MYYPQTEQRYAMHGGNDARQKVDLLENVISIINKHAM